MIGGLRLPSLCYNRHPILTNKNILKKVDYLSTKPYCLVAHPIFIYSFWGFPEKILNNQITKNYGHFNTHFIRYYSLYEICKI